MRVAEFLSEQHVPFESILHPPAFTAQKRAKYAHVSGRQLAKGVLLVGPAGFFLAVLPATRHIDFEALACHVGGPVRLAETAEMAQVFTDCEWGVVPPFGSLYGLPTLLEESLPGDAWIVLEANTSCEAVRMRCQDFERLQEAHRFRFAC